MKAATEDSNADKEEEEVNATSEEENCETVNVVDWRSLLTGFVNLFTIMRKNTMRAVKKNHNKTLQYFKSQCSVERNQQDSL